MINLLVLSLFANNSEVSSFYSIAKPLHSYSVKSEVNGRVVYVNDLIEGKFAKNSKIVKIDDAYDKVELRQLKKKLRNLDLMVDIEERNYLNISKLSFKSQLEKDNQLTKQLNLESQKIDLIIRINKLKQTIANKTLKEKKNYIYDIFVEVGDYVNVGSKLYDAHDLSKAKLEIYIPISQANDIKNKTIFLNGKKTTYKIDKIYKVADIKHISSYKCVILIDKVEQFSKLIKVEFR